MIHVSRLPSNILHGDPTTGAHSDIRRGTAADLADRGIVAIYPISGSWKDQPKHNRSEKGENMRCLIGRRKSRS